MVESTTTRTRRARAACRSLIPWRCRRLGEARNNMQDCSARQHAPTKKQGHQAHEASDDHWHLTGWHPSMQGWNFHTLTLDPEGGCQRFERPTAVAAAILWGPGTTSTAATAQPLDVGATGRHAGAGGGNRLAPSNRTGIIVRHDLAVDD